MSGKLSITFGFILLLSYQFTVAQQVNDSCLMAIPLGIVPSCDTIIYSNEGATPDTLNVTPFCSPDSVAAGDVWFSLTFPDTLDYEISVSPSNDTSHISYIVSGLYFGSCENLALSACTQATDSLGTALIITQPDSALTYFLLVTNGNSTMNEGGFNICIEVIPDINTIDEGGSTACSGILYDTGGPDNNYGADESFVYTICPDEPHGCIDFTLDYFNLEATEGITEVGDLLLFYDGDNINAPLIGNLGFDSLVLINQGGSGICYSLTATQCLTIQFLSDEDINLAGFQGHWQCSQDCDDIPLVSVSDTISYATIEAALSSTYVDVKIDTIICGEGSYATFTAPKSTGLGIEKGILLTTGLPENALGPNLDNQFIGTDLSLPGDADLDSISIYYEIGIQSNDACVIELEVTPYDTEISFEYIFGSEEYTYYVNNFFNDIFALLISGPGIDGEPGIGDKFNMAKVPNSNDFVSINSVNNLVNWEYFRNTNNSKSIGYNGLTSDRLGIKKSLTASAQVEPCGTYRLKFAIADRFDGNYDSGVFISEINSGEPEISFFSGSGFSFLSEGCSGDSDVITISLPEPVKDTTQFEVIFSGSASINEDFIFSLADSIIFYPGDSVLHFPIQVVQDTIVEGTETLTITLVNELACKTITLDSISINIYDEVDIFITSETDSLLTCPGLPIELSVVGATHYAWNPDSLFENALSANVTIDSLPQDLWVYVTGSIMGDDGELCSDTDSIYLIQTDTSFSILQGDHIVLCNQDSLIVSIEESTYGYDIEWTPMLDQISADSFLIVLPAQDSTYTYTAITGLPLCRQTDSIIVTRESYEIPYLTTADTTICQGESFVLAGPVNDSLSVYNWAPATYLDDSTKVDAVTTPIDNIEYTLTVISPNGLCEENISVDVDIILNFIEFEGPDSIRICLGDSITLKTLSSTGGGGITWTSDNFDIDTSQIASFSLLPEVDGSVYVALNALGCTAFDTIRIFVDSLPPTVFELDPELNPYCPGNMINFSSNVLDPLQYPNVSYEWTFNDAIIDYPANAMNASIDVEISESTIFYRETINGACLSFDSIAINIPPLDYIVVSDLSTTCMGNPVQLDIATFNFITDIQWQENDLTCIDCTNPVANPSVTTTYHFTALLNGCPIEDSISINVENEMVSIIPDTTFFCENNPEIVTLNVTGSSAISEVQWSVPVDCQNSDCTEVTLLPLVSSTIMAEAAFANGCIAGDEAQIIPLDIPSLSLDASSTGTYAIGQTVTITAQIFPSDPINQTVVWSVNETIVNNSFGFLDLELDQETTVVTIDFIDINGCVQKSEIVLTAAIPIVTMPKAFFPQGEEDLNKSFSFLLSLQGERIEAENIINVSAFNIYNRWGELVFECTDTACAEAGWNGMYKDQPAPSGVYIYYFEAIDFLGQEMFLEGDVTLFR